MTVRTRLINRRYRLERRISLTGTTESWLGFDNVLHRAVAVSLPRQELLRDGPFLVEFLQRSRIATALHHRGIVAAFDSGEDSDTPYLVTEYLGGESLTDIIHAESPFDVDDVAVLVEQLGGALEYAHQRGFVHGDLTSDHVVVDGQGAAKLLGLGIPLGSDGSTVDGDIAALGAIAFEMLTGEEPNAVEADSAGEAYLIDPDVPRNASDVVAIALGAGSARFSSAGSFARSLNTWRSFDPGEFFVAPEPALEWAAPEPLPRSATFPNWPDDDDLIAGAGEPADDAAWPALPERHRNRWLFIAAMVLMIAAGFIVWQSSDSTAATSALQDQIETLAQLSGF
ncbi:MAG TPA: protein kinase [Thermomicrobiales bacterium]|nr:protein kinase [Thermomicrobiales bacterium]